MSPVSINVDFKAKICLTLAAMVALPGCFEVQKMMPNLFEGFLKWGYPQIIYFDRIFHYKPSILGYPYFRNPPKWILNG